MRRNEEMRNKREKEANRHLINKNPFSMASAKGLVWAENVREPLLNHN